VKLPLLAGGSTSLGIAPSDSLPIVYLDRNVEQSLRLKPGVYQTRPYAIVLIAAEPEHDDCSVVGAAGASSKMPVVKPEMRTFTILGSK